MAGGEPEDLGFGARNSDQWTGVATANDFDDRMRFAVVTEDEIVGADVVDG